MKTSVNKYLGLFFAIAGCLTVATVAYAIVTFDPETGTGFVGKGDVQLACGGNNAALQSYAEDVSFTWGVIENYDYVCEWYTGPSQNRTRHTVTRGSGVSVESEIAVEARQKDKQKQFTGFELYGFGDTTSFGEVPEVGDPCPGNPGTGAVVISVELTSSTGENLFVNCPEGSPNAGNSVVLPY